MFLGRVGGPGDARVVVLGDRGDVAAAVGVEGDGELHQSPQGVEGLAAPVDRYRVRGGLHHGLVLVPAVKHVALAGQRVIVHCIVAVADPIAGQGLGDGDLRGRRALVDGDGKGRPGIVGVADEAQRGFSAGLQAVLRRQLDDVVGAGIRLRARRGHDVHAAVAQLVPGLIFGLVLVLPVVKHPQLPVGSVCGHGTRQICLAVQLDDSILRRLSVRPRAAVQVVPDLGGAKLPIRPERDEIIGILVAVVGDGRGGFQAAVVVLIEDSLNGPGVRAPRRAAPGRPAVQQVSRTPDASQRFGGPRVQGHALVDHERAQRALMFVREEGPIVVGMRRPIRAPVRASQRRGQRGRQVMGPQVQPQGNGLGQRDGRRVGHGRIHADAGLAHGVGDDAVSLAGGEVHEGHLAVRVRHVPGRAAVDAVGLARGQRFAVGVLIAAGGRNPVDHQCLPVRRPRDGRVGLGQHFEPPGGIEHVRAGHVEGLALGAVRRPAVEHIALAGRVGGPRDRRADGPLALLDHLALADEGHGVDVRRPLRLQGHVAGRHGGGRAGLPAREVIVRPDRLERAQVDLFAVFVALHDERALGPDAALQVQVQIVLTQRPLGEDRGSTAFADRPDSHAVDRPGDGLQRRAGPLRPAQEGMPLPFGDKPSDFVPLRVQHDRLVALDGHDEAAASLPLGDGN